MKAGSGYFKNLKDSNDHSMACSSSFCFFGFVLFCRAVVIYTKTDSSNRYFENQQEASVMSSI
jgi:hypothetical protein